MVDFDAHPVRGRFNAGFFRFMDGYIDWNLRAQKVRLYQGLPLPWSSWGQGWAPTSATSSRGPS